MTRHLLIIIILICSSLTGIGCFNNGSDNVNNKADEIDRDAILFEARKSGLIMDFDEVDKMSQLIPIDDQTGRAVESVGQYVGQDRREWDAAALADVTGGGSYGIAHTKIENGVFILFAELGNLQQPSENYFYEGWLVRRGKDMSVVKTGTLVITESGYANVYTSSQDFSDYSFYVVTLEKNDNNLSDGEHILEGIFD